MTDLTSILPAFPTTRFTNILARLDHHEVTTTDLLTLHPADLSKQTQLPLLDLKRLIAAVQTSLSDDLGPPQRFSIPKFDDQEDGDETTGHEAPSSGTAEFVSTLDDDLDKALGGGCSVGCITEFTGESGAGKTQFLLSLCLAVQLPAPRGLGKQALYISTEAPLATRRLAQMLATHPVIQQYEEDARPSLDNVHSTVTPDLESQDHIMETQVPVMLDRHDIGLIILDSVAANYRAEFERHGSRGSNMAARSTDLIRLGALLRDIARRRGIAVVVANQVADRFASSRPNVPTSSDRGILTQESPLAARSMPPPPLSSAPSSSMPFFADNDPPPPPALDLDHQQRWFTGWGDEPRSSMALKTPSLGLVWSTQIAARVALFKRPVYGRGRMKGPMVTADDYDDDGGITIKNWRRWMKVVFAPYVPGSGQGLEGAVEFMISKEGLQSVPPKESNKRPRPDDTA